MFPRFVLICTIVVVFIHCYSLAASASGDADEAQNLKPTLRTAIAEVLYNINQAQVEAIQANQPMLTQSLYKMEHDIKFASRIACLLSRSFSDVDEEQCVERMALEVSKRLEDEVRKEFRAKTDVMAGEKKEEITEMMDMGVKSVADVRQAVTRMTQLVEELKDEIDGVAKDLEPHLHKKVTKVEGEVMKEYIDNLQKAKAPQQERADQEAAKVIHNVKEAKQEATEANQPMAQSLYKVEESVLNVEMDQNGGLKKKEDGDYNKEDEKKHEEATKDKIEAKGKEEVSEKY